MNSGINYTFNKSSLGLQIFFTLMKFLHQSVALEESGGNLKNFTADENGPFSSKCISHAAIKVFRQLAFVVFNRLAASFELKLVFVKFWKQEEALLLIIVGLWSPH